MIEIAEEMRNCLIQIQNCFDLLIPSVNFFDIIREEPTQDKDIDSDSNDKDGRQSEDSESESEQLFQQQPWYRNFTPITCSIPDTVNVTETDDNKDIINSLEDQVRLIDARYVPKINKWLEILTKYGSEEDNIKRAIDMKAYMTKAKDKFQHLQIEKKKKTKTIDTQDSDEESDFEEVPEKEGYEANIPEELHEEYGIKKKNIRKAKPTGSWSVLQENSEEDPASYQAAVKAIEKKFEKNTESYNQSSSQDSKSAISGRTKKLKEIAPIVPFGNDLLNWGSKIEVPLLPNYDLEHRFYTKKDIDNEDKIDKNALASYSSRVINYVGKRELAKWKCRALMPNGSLCERMDKKKCPFHGTIIPRNEFGVAAEGYIDESKEIKKKEKNPWEDEELLREIEAAKGVSLMKKKKRGKQKDTQLTNIDKIKNTSRDRLKKKLLHKSAIKRVGELLDTIDMKKHKDKFANTFGRTFTFR
ncbi:DgyrCDS11609 [Dimorphilus gyrociliatus]|uniref:DgyrCDS11609 n=1 Tax=Dimorphilus gyrociliatus TaxID=2664684 RepID=A0A7I8W3W9_9ANNE|nr:DgyrCDS11609 [Dimorphilus gyrociliatus]